LSNRQVSFTFESIGLEIKNNDLKIVRENQY
jgi:hypothetical protein